MDESELGTLAASTRSCESDHDTLLAGEDQTVEGTGETMLASGEQLVDVDRGTLRLEGGLRYAKRESLGQGGMGVVELSTDRLIGRDVAIKRLRPQLGDDPRTAQRFLREARIQGQLEHPAIVPIYDLGQTEDGTLYFAMKRLKGRTLREILTQLRQRPETVDARFSQRRLLSAFSQVCQAIAYAHSRAVVHRDLKPDNLMFGEHGEVYVLDWGIARVLGHDDDAGAVEIDVGDDATRQGAIVGTVGYMSPEQAEGDREHVDARSDVWSLGAILFELLSLEPLIPRAGVVQMLTATIIEVDGDPSHKNPNVAPELAALCVAATAKDREQRLPSAQALSDAIEQYLDGDRDLQMRRAKAEQHALTAEQAAQRSFASDDVELRSAAMHEAGVALALDPGHTGARKTLLELLTRPPEQMPDGARHSFDQSRMHTLSSFYRQSIVAMSIYSPLFLLAMFFVDLREVWVLPAAAACGLMFLAGCIRGLRRPRAESWVPLVLHASLSLCLMLFTRLLTPLLVVPVLATVNTLVTHGYRGRMSNWAFAAVGITPVLGAAVLEWLGVWSSTMSWVGGELHLHNAMIALGDSPWIIPSLVLFTVFPVVVGTVLIGRVQQVGEKLVREAHVQRWQLEQLVGSTDDPPPSPA